MTQTVPHGNKLEILNTGGGLQSIIHYKKKTFLDMPKSIETLMTLIAAGLPASILHKINSEALKDFVDFFNEVSKYEHMVNK